jgi:hypothetical protein
VSKRVKAIAPSTFDSQAAVDAVIKATGKEPDNPKLLATDLDRAAAELADIVFWKKAAAGRARKSIRRLRKELDSLSKNIDSDPVSRRFFDTTEIKRLGKQAKHFEQWQRMRRRPKAARQPAPLDWLIRSLRDIYCARFGVACWSWHEDKPEGAIIDFIAAVLAQLDYRCSRTTIARALSRCPGSPNGTMRPSRPQSRASART